ncbi:hypothetical protein [uncultured Algibacter sp.]|uniref:hypothetical protein n=1 Tax=uncultured Algibacter sp. TaxID=298659 RepID=UPI0032162701
MSIPVSNIGLNQKTRVQEYFVDTIQHIHVNEHLTENRISTKVKKEYIEKDDFGHLLRFDITYREQTNLNGMLAVEDWLSVLFKKLILYLDDQGKIKSIVNLKEIKQDWYEQKDAFKKEFKFEINKINPFLEALDITLDNQKDFIQIIEKSDIATLLLPPIYNQELLLEKPVIEQKNYDNFFGNNDVPLNIDTSLLAYNEVTNGHQIFRTGEIDYVYVDLNGIKDFFRKNYNNQSLPAKLDVAYLEAIDLDQYHDVDIATLMMGIEIKNLYQFRQISKTKKINS